MRDQRVAVLRPHGLDAKDREAGPKAEQNVGVVDRPPAWIAGIEDESRIAELPVEIGDDLRVGPLAEAGEGALTRPVEKQAARAF